MNFWVLTLLYCFVLAVEIFANLTHNTALQYFSKPLLMPLLIFYFAANTRRFSRAGFFVLSALLFSWFGDLFLLLDKTYQTFFIYGLTAFLVAHIFYIFYFWRMRALNKIRKLPNFPVFVGIAVYGISFFAFLAPNALDLLIPLAVYGFVISVMLAASLTAFDFSKDEFGRLSAAGALLFVASDSILAVNRFISPFEYAPAFVMLTYAAAQFLITEGSLRNLRAIEKR